MEIGTLDSVYYVQYKTAAGHWVTKQEGYGTEANARSMARWEQQTFAHETRVVRQTTTNTVI